MKVHTHLIFGITLGTLAFPQVGLPGVVGAIFGSMLPDSDYRFSTLGRTLPFLPLIGGTHRGWFHTLPGAILFSIPFLLLSSAVGGLVFAGYILHLLLDTLNPSGIMWLWPINKRKIHVLDIRTGGLYEAVIFFACTVTMLVILW